MAAYLLDHLDMFVWIAVIMLAVAVLSILIPAFSYAGLGHGPYAREDNMLWESNGHNRFTIATDFGLERFKMNLGHSKISRTDSAEGSGHRPVELEIINNDDAIVLTRKTLDFYTLHGDKVRFHSSYKLKHVRPLDMEKMKRDLVLVVYEEGVELIGINSRKKYFYEVDQGFSRLRGAAVAEIGGESVR